MRMNENIRFIDIRGYYNYLGAHKLYIYGASCAKGKMMRASTNEVACVVYYYRLLYIQNYFIFY